MTTDTIIHALHIEIHTSYDQEAELFTHAVQLNRPEYLDEEHAEKLAADAFSTALSELRVVATRHDKELLLAFGLWMIDDDSTSLDDEEAGHAPARAMAAKVKEFLAEWARD